jgi:hypothetical protein
MLTRREFGKRAALTVVGSRFAMLAEMGAVGGLAATQISCGPLATEIEDWVGLGISAFNSILTELAANGVTLPPTVSAIAQDVIAALTAIVAAAKEYAAFTPPPTTVIQKLQDALKAATDQLALFLQSVSIPGAGLISLIANIAGVIFSAIAGFLNQVPTPAPATVKVFRMASSYHMAAGADVPVTAMHIGKFFKHEFRGKVNGQLDKASKSGVLVLKAAYI